MFFKRRRLFHASLLEILPSFLAVFVGLCWCIWFMRSVVYTVFALCLTSWIWWFWAREVWRVWKQTLEFESDALLFFDGQTRYEVRFESVTRAEVHLSSGNFRLGQAPSQEMVFHLSNADAVKVWDLSNFTLRAVFRVLVELAHHADLPPVDVHFLAVSTTEADVCGSARGLGTLSPMPCESQKSEQLTRWERDIQGLQRHFQFTPN